MTKDNSYSEFLVNIRKKLQGGIATEHSYRPALQDLLEAFSDGISAINEPKRIECGAPDFKITRKTVPLGYVETKDIGTDLDEMEQGKGPYGDQFIRYREGLPNWILTDYLDFRWFVNGYRRFKIRIAELGPKNRIAPIQNGEQKLRELLQAFLNEPALTVSTAKDLAISLAHMTRIVRAQIVEASIIEEEKGEKRKKWLHSWLAAFQKTLIPDLDEKQFADMFAQTLSYGLFTARIHTPAGKSFSRELAAYDLPKTNPFLRKLFAEIAGINMPESISWAVDDIVELLKHANIAEILRDFGKGIGKGDPVVHFYETFLAAYDPKLRKIRGVYFTPKPVVSYIVGSVSSLLRSHFNRPMGLADEDTFILDPAAGTATFLYCVIEHIYDCFSKQTGAWDAYVSEHLLRRVFGFELLMAPYTVAHLKLGMQLNETGYKFGSDQRLGVYLTNTLEKVVRKSGELYAQWVIDEADTASEIKKKMPIMVVLGNPPYSGISANRGDWITNLLEVYRTIDGQALSEKKVWLKNDYVKFIRFGQWRIEQTKYGILSFITDHSYLDSPTFRGMRKNLLNTFDELYIYNLHGNTKRHETAPDGGIDKSVFDIKQGTAISIFIKLPKTDADKKVFYADLWGDRQIKYAKLSQENVAKTIWKTLHPMKPFYEFVPVNRSTKTEYHKAWQIKDIFAIGSNGVQTSRDALVVGFDKKSLIKTIEDFIDTEKSDSEIRSKFFGTKQIGEYLPGDTREWDLSEARKKLRDTRDWRTAIIEYQYRPFDVRELLDLDPMIDWPRHDVMKHIAHSNLALCVGRAGLVASGSWDLAFCSNRVCDHNLFYRGSSLNFPLYLYEKTHGLKLFKTSDDYQDRHPNIAPAFVKELTTRLKLAWLPNGVGDLKKTIGPEDILNYAYAIFYSPTYRVRYADFLNVDFPRLPLTNNPGLFSAVATKGAELVALHTLKSPKVYSFRTSFPEKGNNIVDKIKYTDKDKRVWVNKLQYFGDVPKAVWEFYVGGYQVCHKWLKDRKGQKLSYDNIKHFQKIVVALNETIKIMSEIDRSIPSWPIT